MYDEAATSYYVEYCLLDGLSDIEKQQVKQAFRDLWENVVWNGPVTHMLEFVMNSKRLGASLHNYTVFFG